ncbi:MAG TPA: metalloregulator ArsR/SmtB family transcription factor [Anaerolineae bacterium]|nr:metalloregulator ArsR/SmtB family transcription factor [Anaerolineae bacterium]
MTLTTPTLDELNLLHASICQAIGDPKRILILYTLHEQPLYVSALADTLNLPQPTVSRHLRVLRQHGLVSTTRQANTVVYQLALPQIITILDQMRHLLRASFHQQTDILAPPTDDL